MQLLYACQVHSSLHAASGEACDVADTANAACDDSSQQQNKHMGTRSNSSKPTVNMPGTKQQLDAACTARASTRSRSQSEAAGTAAGATTVIGYIVVANTGHECLSNLMLVIFSDKRRSFSSSYALFMAFINSPSRC